jgi:hypothetical protein
MAEDSADVTVRGGGREHRYFARRGTAVVVRIDDSLLFTGSPWLDTVNAVSRRTFAVTADRPVAVYCFFATAFGGEAFTPLPVEQWGTEYRAMSTRHSIVSNIETSTVAKESSIAPPQIVIIAASDSTVVSIGPGRYRTRARTDAIVLDAGEAYLFQPDTGDVGGARIVASKPIGVISGNTRTWGIEPPYGATDPYPGSSLQNVTAEWLSPVTSGGTEFIYRAHGESGSVPTNELIRIYATSPGVTTIRPSYSLAEYTVAQGSFFEIRTHTLPAFQRLHFSFTTDKPAQAAVVSGHAYRRVNNREFGLIDLFTWSPAMAPIRSRSEYGRRAFVHVPTYPFNLTHWLVVTADSGSGVIVDGRYNALWPMGGSTKRTLRITLAPGDHEIEMMGGGMAATVYGQLRGYEGFTPGRARGREDAPPGGALGDAKRAARLQHTELFFETAALSYAYPVVFFPRSLVSDSLAIDQDYGCDSSTAVVRHLGPERFVGQDLQVRIDPTATTNADVRLTPIMTQTIMTGVTIRFAPRDRSLEAHALVTVVSASGRRWTLPFDYYPQPVRSDPDSLELTNVPVGSTSSSTLRLINRGQISVTVTRIALARGDRGFSLAAAPPLPFELRSGEGIEIGVDFIADRHSALYRDSLIVETSCRGATVPLLARSLPPNPEPLPLLEGYDWSERWLSTLDACTKSGIESYEADVRVRNAGNLAFIVRSLTLVGPDADAGYFRIDSSDSSRWIYPFRMVMPDSIRPGGLLQRVRFLPADERAYRCVVRLVVQGGDTLEAELRGIGVESHVAIAPDPLDLGEAPFVGTDAVAATGAFELAARPTRQLTIRHLTLSGTGFALDRSGGFVPPDRSDPTTWFVLAPGERRSIPVRFVPPTTGAFGATLVAEGDHARCDDSIATVMAVATRQVDASGTDVGASLGCAERAGVITVRNGGAVALTLASATLADPAGEFAIGAIALPLDVPAESSVSIPIVYRPRSAGAHRADVRIVLAEAGGAVALDTLVAVTGRSSGLRASASIARDHRLRPGTRVGLPLVLDAPVDAGAVASLRLSLTLPREILLFHGLTTSGALLEGWTVTELTNDGSTYEALLTAPAGETLVGVGALAHLDVTPFLGSAISGEIPFALTVGERACLAIETSAGLVRIDSICGLSFRLIEATSAGYLLRPPSPNPSAGAATIAFDLGLDGPTTVDMHDEQGRIVERLVDAWLPPGSYSVLWSAVGVPSGRYHVRVTSGAWSASGAVVLEH